ncbi:MAG: hypothetical protein IKH77_00245 [Clostridia bacterium]|nr:hypothetical protein [Clostridia bacterium]
MKRTLHDSRRRLLALLMVVWMALAPAAAPAEPAGLTPEQYAAFVQASDGLEADLEPLALAAALTLGDGEKGGAAYVFLCRMTAPGEEARLAMMYVEAAPDQGAALQALEALPLLDGAGNPAAPDAEILRGFLFLPTATLPEGTAGASLQEAERVTYLWLLCGMYDFAAPEQDAVRNALAEAEKGLPEEMRSLYTAHAPGVLAEARRLLDPGETAGGQYEDAGMADLLAALRGEERACRSMEALLALLP